jgi:hypothetical protein
MSDTPKKRTWLWALLAVLGVAVAATAAYLVANSGPSRVQKDLASGDVEKMRSALLAADTEMLESREGRETGNLTIEAMKKMSVEDLMKLWEGDDLTDEQREALGENMRAIWMNYMSETAEKYFVASKEEKVKILDQQLDEWKSFMDRMRAYREAHENDPEYQKRQQERRDRWRNSTREERKEQTVNMNTDQQTKMFYMFQQMRKRAQERGMDLGWGGRRGGDDSERSDDRQRRRERQPDRDRNADRDRDRNRDED